ncbi:MAG: alpha/beta fold hydrolase [Acidobacteriota bacterium]
MKNILTSFFLFIFVFLLISGVKAQDLTVHDIMAEPSIAGMRVEGEKLSPDGSKVAYLWNAEGKMPMDLYLVSTSGGGPTRLLGPRDLPPPSERPTKENKLDYGLTIRDDFVKARESQIGGLEWSPDSKKLLFVQNGDIFVLNIEDTIRPAGGRAAVAHWKDVESAIQRFADRVPDLIQASRSSDVKEFQIYGQVAEARSKLLNALMEPPTGPNGSKSDGQIHAVLDSNKELERLVGLVVRLVDIYPSLRKGDKFSRIGDEIAGTKNRINVALTDYQRSEKFARPKRYTKTQSPEFGARFLDSDRIIFQQSGNVLVLNTFDATLVQLTREANQPNFISINNATASKDGSMLAYVVSDSSKQKALIVPNYLDEFVQASTVRRGWSEQKIFVTPTDASRDRPFEIKLPPAEGVSNFRRLIWAIDGRSLIVDRNDKDTKRRQLFFIHNVGGKDEQTILVTEETDDKWQAPLSSIVEPNPKNPGQLIYCSEVDGFNHIYLAALKENSPEPNPRGEIRQENPSDPGYSSTVSIRQLTRGNWQVEWAKWTADGNRIVYSSTEENTAERQFYALSPASGEKVELFAGQKGTKSGAQLDEVHAQPTLVYDYSTWDHPDELYAVRVCPGCEGINSPVPITSTVPAAFVNMRWNAPQFLTVPSRDDKKIPARVYLPNGFDPRQKYPMVIFVHGAGYLQNVINGWNNYSREFMFNELLVQKGYVVLDIDYRGSAGYGREWRTDVYDFLGGKDYDDHIDAIDHMIKNYSVDPTRVGVYGGSYGGFMAEMLAFRAPEKIAAAAALRPVADWKNYYASSPGYTAQRLGFPDKNPEGYKRSSPITYADGLKTHLLILHGLSDTNVHVQDSMQLVEKLVRLGKTPYFETMFYPSENHGFVRPESWTDEYERILAFFDKHLK